MNTHVSISYEETLKAKARQVRKRLIGKPSAVNVAKAVVIEQTSVVTNVRKMRFYLKPTTRMMLNEPKHHVLAWKAYQSALSDFNAPRRFVKLKCFEHAVTYEEICSRRRTDRLAAARKLIIIDTHEEFPLLSSTQLGKLINKDHTSVLNYLGRLKCKSEAGKRWRAKQVRAE